MALNISGFILLLIGLWVGYGFADWDQRTPLLMHRNILTHGFIVPLILFTVAASLKPQKLITAKFLPVGFALAMAVHLAFDLFPYAWRGFALIHVPFLGQTSSAFSFLWILASIAICLFVAWRYVSGRGELEVALMALAGTATLHSVTSLRTAVPAVGVLAVVALITLPRRHREVLMRREGIG